MDLTPLLQVIVSALIVALGWIFRKYVIPFIKSKTTAEQRADIMAVIMTVVKAAEQMTGLDTGKLKKDYVLKVLIGMGLRLSEDALNAMIEAAVFELNAALDSNGGLNE